MKTIKIVTEVKIDNDVNPSEIADWISCHMDNIPEEELEEMDIDPNSVEVGITYLQ